MQKIFSSIAVVGKYMSPAALESMRPDLIQLCTHLRQKGVDVFIEANTAQFANITDFPELTVDQIATNADLAIVMGGDGTMLSVARNLIDSQVPLVGINRGRFGFLTDLRTENMLEVLGQMLDGDFIKEPRMLLEAKIIRNAEIVHQSFALNDIVIKSGLRLIEMAVHIDEYFVYKQRADGLIVSTPTGTTAYALSAGGPILHPGLEAISLVPICPHTLSNRPIAVNSDSQIRIVLMQFDEAQLSFDGQHQVHLEVGDTIQIQRAEKTVALLHPMDYCYFDMLRNKLNWG